MSEQNKRIIDFNMVVKCKDDLFGTVIRIDDARRQVGVQVPGEEDIRWIDRGKISVNARGMIIEL